MVFDKYEPIFDYSLKESWDFYIFEYLAPLCKDFYTLYNCLIKLRQRLIGKKIDELSYKEKLFVLGISNKTLLEPEVLKFLREIMGISTKEGIVIPIKTKSFLFFKKLSLVLSKISFILQKTKLKINENPESLLSAVSSLLIKLYRISIAQNCLSFFLWSLNNLPICYAKKIYPLLDEIFPLLERRFGLSKIDVFGTKDPDYYLLTYKNQEEASLGYSIFGINLLLISDEAFDHFFQNVSAIIEIPNPREEYIKKVKEWDRKLVTESIKVLGKELPVKRRGMIARMDIPEVDPRFLLSDIWKYLFVKRLIIEKITKKEIYFRILW